MLVLPILSANLKQHRDIPKTRMSLNLRGQSSGRVSVKRRHQSPANEGFTYQQGKSKVQGKW